MKIEEPIKGNKMKKNYLRLDFVNCNIDYDYTIVQNFNDVKDYEELLADVDLSDFAEDEAPPSIKITVVEMTEDEYEALVEQWEKEA